jgi:outer membrane immunogenic protein
MRETAVKFKTSLAALLALGAVSGAALAQNAQWDGFYIGLNAGVLTNSTCTNWTPTNPAVIARFNTSNCPSNSVFLGGGQLGYNWQINQIVIGLEGDYDGVNSKTKSRIYDYPGGAVVPAGTFSFYGKNTPNGLGTIRARFGYAVDNWLPYVTAGAALAGGSTRSSATFTPLNATAPTASFAGGRTYSSNGWTAGAGVEYQIERAWSVKAEWLYVKLGSGANQVSSCTTTIAGGCDAFGNLNLQSTLRDPRATRAGRSGRSPGGCATPATAAPNPAAAEASSTVPGHTAGRRGRSVRLPVRYHAGGPFRDEFGGVDRPGQGAARQDDREPDAPELRERRGRWIYRLDW